MYIYVWISSKNGLWLKMVYGWVALAEGPRQVRGTISTGLS